MECQDWITCQTKVYCFSKHSLHFKHSATLTEISGFPKLVLWLRLINFFIFGNLVRAVLCFCFKAYNGFKIKINGIYFLKHSTRHRWHSWNLYDLSLIQFSSFATYFTQKCMVKRQHISFCLLTYIVTPYGYLSIACYSI